jgi:tRNA-Thr(GGU) m(6)t(6)A37 methyltransferase TsaA
MNQPSEPARLTLTPIGVVRSPFVEKMQAPRQPGVAGAADGTVVLTPGRGFEHALEDLTTFRYVWLLFWFHQAEGWRPKVQPPRSEKRRGLFATRSPHRPNPLGMSLVELVRIDGLVLHVRGLDLLDGTPVLDIKPYIPYADSRPDADHGWLDEAQGLPARDPLPAHRVEFAEGAAAELELLRGFGIELEPPIRQVLELGPEPHPYRRIRKEADGACLSLKDFRVWFRADGERRIVVTRIQTGYRPQQLALGAFEAACLPEPGLSAHRALAAKTRV